MPAKRNPTKFDKAKQREDTKLLVFLGYPVREAARLTGATEANALKWNAQDGWMAELKRIQFLAQIQQPGKFTDHDSSKVGNEVAANAAYDLAKVNKQSRAALAQVHNLAIMETLKQMTEKPGKIQVETPQDLKATGRVAGQG